jgi:hypothetical protein
LLALEYNKLERIDENGKTAIKRFTNGALDDEAAAALAVDDDDDVELPKMVDDCDEEQSAQGKKSCKAYINSA